METLVEMKENGSYEEKMKKMAENFDEIKKRVENATNQKLTDKNIIFDVILMMKITKLANLQEL